MKMADTIISARQLLRNRAGRVFADNTSLGFPLAGSAPLANHESTNTCPRKKQDNFGKWSPNIFHSKIIKWWNSLWSSSYVLCKIELAKISNWKRWQTPLCDWLLKWDKNLPGQRELDDTSPIPRQRGILVGFRSDLDRFSFCFWFFVLLYSFLFCF